MSEPDIEGIRDRCRGVLLGLAAGDRNGGPVRMALRLAASLLRRETMDHEDVLAGYLDWWRTDGVDSGPTVAAVMAKIDAGIGWEEAAKQVDLEARGQTAGCNPAHRSSPLAMHSAIPDDQMRPSALLDSFLTHWHELAADASAATVVLCRALIRGRPWPEALVAATNLCHGYTHQALAVGGQAPGGTGGFAPEVL